MKKTNKEIIISNTILGKDSEFEGNLKFIGAITIEGSFKGSVSGDGTIIIGLGADIKADIQALDVNIYGKIYGQVSAANKVCIYSSGEIWGDINAPKIQIEKGAIIRGKCVTHKIDQADKKELAVINILK
ncbi:MAG: polymer-forming cytoskeletal protein [Pseudomonadota bacterium]